MRLRTYLALTLRYMNPRFKQHLYPYDWKTWSCWKKGIRVGLPFPLLFIVTVLTIVAFFPALKEYLYFTESKKINVILAKVYLIILPIILSFFLAKKIMPKPGEANQYDRKTLDFQLALFIITTICTLFS